MTFGELLALVIGLLEQSGVPYMVTGSLASSYHGEPRATRDADIVIDPSPEALERLTAGLLDAGFHVDRDAAREALVDRSQFNAIGADAMKIDFIVRRDRPFSVEEFRRRQPADLLDARVRRHGGGRHPRQARVGEGDGLRPTARRRRRDPRDFERARSGVHRSLGRHPRHRGCLARHSRGSSLTIAAARR